MAVGHQHSHSPWDMGFRRSALLCCCCAAEMFSLAISFDLWPYPLRLFVLCSSRISASGQVFVAWLTLLPRIPNTVWLSFFSRETERHLRHRLIRKKSWSPRNSFQKNLRSEYCSIRGALCCGQSSLPHLTELALGSGQRASTGQATAAAPGLRLIP